MPAPKLDFRKLISQIPEHVGDMPPESARPIEHFQLDAGGYWNLLRYFDRKTADGYAGPRERHVLRLRSMVVLGIVETFERFLKETAAVCVDQLAGRVLTIGSRYSRSLFAPAEVADRLAQIFREKITLAGAVGTPR